MRIFTLFLWALVLGLVAGGWFFTIFMFTVAFIAVILERVYEYYIEGERNKRMWYKEELQRKIDCGRKLTPEDALVLYKERYPENWKYVFVYFSDPEFTPRKTKKQ